MAQLQRSIWAILAKQTRWPVGWCLALLLTAAPALALGQAPDPKKKIPPPEEIIRKTKDGVDLRATFYPSNVGKEAVPVLCIHMFKGSRADYDGLAQYLQRIGHAVLVPDLRGHGRSTKQVRPDGREVEIDPNRLTRPDLDAMVAIDLEAMHDFLIEKNNAAELNVDKLCVIGAEMGAVLAMNWAMLDWSWPQYPSLRQGQDVKALVLLSPQWAFKGVTINPALQHPRVPTLSYLIVAGGQDTSFLREAKSLERRLEKFHPAPPPREAAEKKSLFFLQLNTSLQGTKLLGERSLNLDAAIAQFIDLRLVKKPFPWAERKRLFE